MEVTAVSQLAVDPILMHAHMRTGIVKIPRPLISE